MSPPRRAGRIGRPSKWAGRGWDILPECQEESGVPSGVPARVERPYQRAERGRESLPEGRERQGHPPVGLRVVGMPS